MTMNNNQAEFQAKPIWNDGLNSYITEENYFVDFMENLLLSVPVKNWKI